MERKKKMLICEECGKVLGKTGNNQKMYSCCLPCGRKYEETVSIVLEERLFGKVSDDKELSRLEWLKNSNPDDGSWKGR